MGDVNTVYVNGIEYDFSSLTIQVSPAAVTLRGGASGNANPGGGNSGLGGNAGTGASLFRNVTFGVKAIEYTHKNTRGSVRGTHRQRIGRTPGEYEASGSVTLYKRYADDFIDIITNKGQLPTFDAPFDLTVIYSVDKNGAQAAAGSPSAGIFGTGIQTGSRKDELRDIFLADDGDSHSQGTNPLEVKFTLDIMSIIKNGRVPIGNMLG